MSTPERMVINVEAQLARRLADEADLTREKLAAIHEQMAEAQQKAEQATDPVIRARAQARVNELVNEEAALLRMIEEQRRAAQLAVQAALSLDDETDPDTLDPIRREALTAQEIAASQAEALRDQWSNLRGQRDALLRGSDWTQLADAGAGVDQAAWATYRQKLRDLPAATPDPVRVRWPTPPS